MLLNRSKCQDVRKVKRSRCQEVITSKNNNIISPDTSREMNNSVGSGVRVGADGSANCQGCSPVSPTGQMVSRTYILRCKKAHRAFERGGYFCPAFRRGWDCPKGKVRHFEFSKCHKSLCPYFYGAKFGKKIRC